MAKNLNLWMVIGITIVVAILSSIVTVSFMQGGISLSPASYSNSTDSTIFQNPYYLQAMFQSTKSAGGIGLKSYDGKMFELQSVFAGGIPGTSKSGFIIYDRNANQYRQVIDSSGNVGIGTTNPQAKLDVNGGINVKGDVVSDGHTLTTDGEVLEMLNQRCEIFSVLKLNSTRQVTGNDICNERNAGTCILMINYDRFSSNDMIQRCTPYVTGRSDKTVAYCCHDP